MIGQKVKMELETKPDYEMCMKRVEAWYDHDVIDRVPVRFSAHNEEYSQVDMNHGWATLKDRWFDAEYQITSFEKGLEGKRFLGETFPVFWPNLGPNVYPCMIGGKANFGEVTTWAEPVLNSPTELNKIGFSRNNEYFKKLDEMTKLALERCKQRYLVGYTDIHSGIDAADALLGTNELLMAMYDAPEAVFQLIKACSMYFNEVFQYFNTMTKAAGQPSVTWIDIPSYDTFHIPGCDVAAMMSDEFFDEFVYPFILAEVKQAKRNVFHVDGKGVARHLDKILEIPEVCAIQWVQGVAEDEPIMQWVPLIKKVQSKGKGIVVDLKPHELQAFMEQVEPQGIYLCMDTHDIDEQQYILNKLLTWK